MKKMTLLSMLLGIGAIIMFLLAGTLNFGIGWALGFVMLFVAAAIALVIAFVEGDEGNEGNNIGSYRMPKI